MKTFSSSVRNSTSCSRVRTGSISSIGSGHAPHHRVLLVHRRIANLELEHEAVDLRFRQHVSALLLDWILSGKNHEWLRQRKGLLAKRHLLFQHGLKQGALDFRRSAIHLIRE